MTNLAFALIVTIWAPAADTGVLSVTSTEVLRAEMTAAECGAEKAIYAPLFDGKESRGVRYEIACKAA